MYLRPFQNDDESGRDLDRDDFSCAEFEALAEQLSDDARMLAERYPAPSPKLVPSIAADVELSLRLVEGPAGGPHWRKVLAASVLVVAGLGALFGTRFGGNQGDLAIDARQGKLDARQEQQELLNHAQVVNDVREPAAPQSLPSISFQEFTGPEQEAVLDLLEENALSQVSLSI